MAPYNHAIPAHAMQWIQICKQEVRHSPPKQTVCNLETDQSKVVAYEHFHKRWRVEFRSEIAQKSASTGATQPYVMTTYLLSNRSSTTCAGRLPLCLSIYLYSSMTKQPVRRSSAHGSDSLHAPCPTHPESPLCSPVHHYILP